MMNTTLKQQSLQDTGVEFIEALLDGELTESSYDDYIEKLAAGGINEGFLNMIYQGKPEWREKHYRRYAPQD